MKPNTIRFENIRIEMARKNLTLTSMSRELPMCLRTLSLKMSGKSVLNLDEAFLIQRIFFPDKDITWLFKEALQIKQ